MTTTTMNVGGEGGSWMEERGGGGRHLDFRNINNDDGNGGSRSGGRGGCFVCFISATVVIN